MVESSRARCAKNTPVIKQLCSSTVRKECGCGGGEKAETGERGQRDGKRKRTHWEGARGEALKWKFYQAWKDMGQPEELF